MLSRGRPVSNWSLFLVIVFSNCPQLEDKVFDDMLHWLVNKIINANHTWVLLMLLCKALHILKKHMWLRDI